MPPRELHGSPEESVDRPTSPTKRRVGFVETHEVNLFTEEDVPAEERWFMAKDYHKMKAESREEAREWRKKGFTILLENTFEVPRSDVQNYLNAFVSLEGDLCRRGLERHLSRRHGEERSDVKNRARHVVLVHQQKMLQQEMKPQEIAEYLAVAYEDVCRNARVFARRLGKADELVVRNGENSVLALEIIEEIQRNPGHRRFERRLSNYSVVSSNSFDSRRQWGTYLSPYSPTKKTRCPGSPASPMEEYYAAIA